jgi:single-stranded-DNA-specific exonuclease
MKQWLIKPKISPELVSKFPEINPVILQLLIDRGLNSQERIDEFLYPDYSQDIHDPFIFGQMKKAVNRIYEARDQQQNVVIYGDYDADGVCGSSILAKTFKKIGIIFDVYIPHRESEGYGLNKAAVKAFKERKINLIVTVDCGVSNTEEVGLAEQLGIDVIITDHHHLPDKLPPALAIIHPLVDLNYPFKFLAGGGVAFKFSQGIIQDSRSNIAELQKESFQKWLLDLVAISTIGDMVPLVGENRTLVKHGLIVLSKTKNLGLQKLMEVAVINPQKMDTHMVGFQIAPRINAAGRMAHANDAYELLVTENIEEAIKISHQLNKRNTERQQLTEKLIQQAKTQLGEVSDKDPILFVVGDKSWSAGIIGLVSSKLTNEFVRPSIALGFDGQKYVASGRSIEEFDLIEAINQFGDMLLRFGGHAGAAGFSILPEKLESFKNKITAYAAEKLADVKFLPKIEIDAELILNDVNWGLVNSLLQFEPYGEDNHKPKFLIRNLTLANIEKVGNDNKHLRLIVYQNDLERKVIAFGFGESYNELIKHKKIDAVVEVGVNQWNGNQEIQLSLVDWQKSLPEAGQPLTDN